MLFVAKILHGLVVDEGVCGPGARLGIRFVHSLPEFGPELGEVESEG